MLSTNEWLSVLLTVKLATVTTVLLLLIGTPLAWWLAHTRHKIKPFLEALVALPLVLPPTVLGFYLLLMLSPNSALGQTLNVVGIGNLVFTFEGLVIGSIVYSFPFVVQPLQSAFSSIPIQQLEMAACLGANRWQQFYKIALPLSRGGFITACVLGFTHTLGEFGIVLMIGGNIPGETQVLSILIYEQVESLNYESAHALALGLLGFSFIVLLCVYRFNKHAIGWKQG